MKHRLLALCAAMLLLFCQAAAEAPAVNDMGLELGGSSVRYPQLTGLGEAVQPAVNAAIMEAGGINDHLTRMAALLNAPVKLTVTYDYVLWGDVFSCAMLADGAVKTSRATQVWSTVNLDLTTGEALPMDRFFTDGDAARAFLAAYLDEQVAPDLSAHLAAGALTPIPEAYTVSPAGLTLYYDIAAFRTLSDQAGTVTILWSEFPRELLSSPIAMTHLDFPEDAKNALATALSEGFPGVPARLDESVAGLVEAHRLLTDPDLYEGGRMIALEDGAFRQVWVLTDALTEEFDLSVVQGIRADRLNFLGLCTGVTTQAQWREALGQPDTTLTVDESQAESWRIVPGASDYYALGDYRLRLHADESGVLRSVFLTR